jgi:hypothetical protein
MKYSPPIFRPARGATLMLVLMFAIVGGMALTSWMYLIGARLQQAERQVDQVTRNIVWNNTFAINQQYALQYSFQDVVTRSASTATLNSGAWGGSDQDSYIALQAFRSGYTYSNPAPYAYPFNNLRDVPTSDGSVFYTRTTGDSDSGQTEHLTLYNYQKSYPSPLLGDLLLVHTKPSGTGATVASICRNLQVNGRVVIYDSTASTANVRATEVLNLTKTGTNTTLNTSGATMLPTNYNALPRFTAGYGGSGTPSAVLDGSLNMISNPTFTPGSLVDIMTNNGGYTNVSAGSASGTSTSAVQVTLNYGTPTYPPPTISPYNYSYTNPFNMVTVRLKPPSGTLGHLRINGSVDQLVLQGQTTSTDWTAADALPPVIIWMEQEARDIRFVGENNRRLVLAIGTGSGLTCYMGWSGSSLVAGGPLRWRLHLINQYRNIYLAPPSGLNVALTGSIRTNWHINCTDSSATTRFTLSRETSPGNLPLLLPRDAWFEPYTLVR